MIISNRLGDIFKHIVSEVHYEDRTIVYRIYTLEYCQS